MCLGVQHVQHSVLSRGLTTAQSFSVEDCLAAVGQAVIDVILAGGSVATGVSSSSSPPTPSRSTTHCPDTSWTTHHQWYCPYLEDPYWICALCGEQTQCPSVLLPPAEERLEAVPEPTPPITTPTTTASTHPPPPPPPPQPTPFRIQKQRTSGIPPKRPPKLGGSLARIKRLMDHPQVGSGSDRKYLSKKKQQAIQVLQLFRGDSSHIDGSHILARVREAWCHRDTTLPPTVSMLAVLKQLNLTAHNPDLGYLLRRVNTDQSPIDQLLEPALLLDLDRVLRAYLRYEGQSTKRRPLDCSYLVYQLLRHHGADVHCVQVTCRDLDYHNQVYPVLAGELKLGSWPIVAP